MSGWTLLVIILLTLAIWLGFNYWRVRRAAKIVNNETFNQLIRKGQLVDVREPAEFHRKHILGARNIPATQFKASLSALRKDKPVLLYENTRSQKVANAALALKKAGYTDVYILDYGIDNWTGKVKEG